MKRVDRDSLRIRIARLKRLIEERQATPDLPETIQHILKMYKCDTVKLVTFL